MHESGLGPKVKDNRWDSEKHCSQLTGRGLAKPPPVPLTAVPASETNRQNFSRHSGRHHQILISANQLVRINSRKARAS